MFDQEQPISVGADITSKYERTTIPEIYIFITTNKSTSKKDLGLIIRFMCTFQGNSR